MNPRNFSASILILVCALAIPLSTAANSNVFVFTNIQFQITKPTNWHILSTATVEELKSRLLLNDPKFQRVLREKVSAPVFTCVKYPTNYSGINPSIKVQVWRGSTTNPKELLSMTIDASKRILDEFRVVSDVADGEIGGLKAGHMKTQFITKYSDGRRSLTVSEVWAAQRDDLSFVIALSSPSETANTTEKEFEEVLRSMRFKL